MQSGTGGTRMDMPNVGLLGSNSCPGDIILNAFDLATGLRDSGISIVSGFQTPLERELLGVLLRGSQPIVVCPARNAEGMRVPREWRAAIDDGRLTISAPFPAYVRRPTRESAEKRNRHVVDLAAAVMVIHASPGGSTERAVRYALELGKPVFTLDAPENGHLVEMGLRAVSVEAAVPVIRAEISGVEPSAEW